MKIQPLHSEKYYYANWDKFLEETPLEHCRNLEKELTRAMEVYKRNGLPAELLQSVQAVEAHRIAESCEKMVREQLPTVKKIIEGTAAFGYTTKRQEIEARYHFRQRFDFNCLQLRDFKAKYCK